MTEHDEVAARLAALRGERKLAKANARTVAGLLDHPGCRRRAVLDAAGVDKATLVSDLGYRSQNEMSLAALVHGQAFERMLKRDGCALLLAVCRETLDLPVPAARILDLSHAASGGRPQDQLTRRAAETRRHLRAMLRGDAEAYNLLAHTITTLGVGGRTVYLEQDALAFLVGGRLYVVEIKDFPLIDGLPTDQLHLQQAAKQAAVYVASLQDTVRVLAPRLGMDPAAAAALVSTDIILVCQKNFGAKPIGKRLDVRRELQAVRRQLARSLRVEDILDDLPPDLTFDVGRAVSGSEVERAALEQAVGSVDADYLPWCMTTCDLSPFCRVEATACGNPAVLGVPARNVLGSVDRLDEAVALADGATPTEVTAEVAEDLRAARLAYEQGLRRAGRTP